MAQILDSNGNPVPDGDIATAISAILKSRGWTMQALAPPGPGPDVLPPGYRRIGRLTYHPHENKRV